MRSCAWVVGGVAGGHLHPDATQRGSAACSHGGQRRQRRGARLAVGGCGGGVGNDGRQALLPVRHVAVLDQGRQAVGSPPHSRGSSPPQGDVQSRRCARACAVSQASLGKVASSKQSQGVSKIGYSSVCRVDEPILSRLWGGDAFFVFHRTRCWKTETRGECIIPLTETVYRVKCFRAKALARAPSETAIV